MNDETNDEQRLKNLGKHARERQMRDALAPLPAEFNQRMVAQIKQAVKGPQQSAPETARPRRRAWIAIAASVMAAIGLTVSLMPGTQSQSLPGFGLEFRGGAQMRSDDASAPVQFSDQLDVVLRPTQDTQESLTASVYRRENSAWVAMPVSVQWSDSGAARIRGTLDATLGLTPGAQEFAFVVARTDRAPDPEVIDAQTTSPDWLVLRQRFVLVP